MLKKVLIYAATILGLFVLWLAVYTQYMKSRDRQAAMRFSRSYDNHVFAEAVYSLNWCQMPKRGGTYFIYGHAYHIGDSLRVLRIRVDEALTCAVDTTYARDRANHTQTSDLAVYRVPIPDSLDSVIFLQMAAIAKQYGLWSLVSSVNGTEFRFDYVTVLHKSPTGSLDAHRQGLLKRREHLRGDWYLLEFKE